jgi:hypothetical protein
MPQFDDLPATSRPFLSISQDVIDVLESVTAAEKAQAVPLMRIWRIDPRTGDPVHGRDGVPSAPLSNKMVEPPMFGATLDSPEIRFRERPPVSMERVSIRSEAPRGVITYRTVELTFVIHRPDVLFGEIDRDADNWSDLLIPGNVFALEYGWRASRGVKNELLNGEGFSDPHPSPPVVVPAVSRIRFAVTNYTFHISPDNQISISVSAYEDGEFNLRQAVLGASAVRARVANAPPRILISPATEAYNEDGLRVVESLQKMVGEDLRSRADKRGNVLFRDVCDVLFARTIDDTYRELGYNPPTLWLGFFNERAGRPAPKFTSTDMSGRPLGDFSIPLRMVETVFSNLLKTGDQLTLYNFINPFLTFFRDPRNWDRSQARIDKDGSQRHTIPQVAIRSIINGKTVAVYIFDIEREFTKFAESDRMTNEELLGGPATRERVRSVLRQRGIPLITFQRGLSYIETSSFDVMNDDQIKSILMRRYLQPTRSDVLDISKRLKLDRAVDPRQILYSSAIQGEITMLGNFALDVFGLVWLEFGVSAWDGPFYVMSREDVISPGSFTTKVGFRSAGTDPLGTQGRIDKDALVAQDKATIVNRSKKPGRRAPPGSQ